MQASRKFIVDDSVIVKAEIAVQDDCSSEPTVSFIHKFTGVSQVEQLHCRLNILVLLHTSFARIEPFHDFGCTVVRTGYYSSGSTVHPRVVHLRPNKSFVLVHARHLETNLF